MQAISQSGAGNGGVSSVSLGIFGLNPVVRYGSPEQKARMLELRAATGLARLWAEGNRAADAHKMVNTIYGEFTEGHDTADLVAARQFLDSVDTVES